MYRIEQTKDKTNLVEIFSPKDKGISVSADAKAFQNFADKGRIKIIKGIVYIHNAALKHTIRDMNYKLITEL